MYSISTKGGIVYNIYAHTIYIYIYNVTVHAMLFLYVCGISLSLDPFPCIDFPKFIPRSEDHYRCQARGIVGMCVRLGPTALPCPGTPLAQNKDSPASVCANLLLLPMPSVPTPQQVYR